MGDVHGRFDVLNAFINKKKPDIILQCGDFGYFPNISNKQKNPKWPKGDLVPKMGNTKLYWCDGNHEDHWSLKELKNNEIYPNVFYMKRGSTLTLPDGRVVLFMGGADSIDKGSRRLGYDWFPEEVITQKDTIGLSEDMNVDIIISHTCPYSFDMISNNMKIGDPSRHALSLLLKLYKPSLFFFAHWHVYKTGCQHGCKWICLNMINKTNGWCYLL